MTLTQHGLPVRSRLNQWWLAGLVLTGLMSAAAGDEPLATPHIATTPTSVDDLRTLEQTVTQVLDQILPAIVAVSSSTSPADSERLPVDGDRFASGVIIRSDGLILSQYHVSHSGAYDDDVGLILPGQPGDTVDVVLHDGRLVEAELLGAFRLADLSLLKLREPGTYPFVPLAEDGAVELGDWVVKPGHPMGYDRSRGVVSRLGRVVYQNQINQITDCLITGGDSGGPIVNSAGQVVGIILNSEIPRSVSITANAVRADTPMCCSAVHKIREKLPTMLKRLVPHDTDYRERHERLARYAAVRDVLPSSEWKNGGTTTQAWREITATTAGSVVEILNEQVRTAYGTVVDSTGWILTKASKLGSTPHCRLANGVVIPARLAATDPAFDIALLRVEATDLQAVRWTDSATHVAGTLVAAPDCQGLPVATGVLSVRAYEKPGPFPTGIQTAPLPPTAELVIPEILGSVTEDQGFTVRFVAGGAAQAGIRNGDVIEDIDGRPIQSQDDLYVSLAERTAGDQLRFRLRRGDRHIERLLTLRSNAYRSNNSSRGELFPAVFEHDIPLSPEECGGPVVDLNGQTLGITIARGSYGCLAIPADAIRRLVDRLRHAQ